MSDQECRNQNSYQGRSTTNKAERARKRSEKNSPSHANRGQLSSPRQRRHRRPRPSHSYPSGVQHIQTTSNLSEQDCMEEQDSCISTEIATSRSSCSEDNDDDSCNEVTNVHVLWWHSPVEHVPIAVEESLINNNILLRWPKTERGMMKDQPKFRIDEMKRHLKQSHTNMKLIQVLSFRRTYLKFTHPYQSMSQLQLGSERNIKESANKFEQAVESYLRHQNIPFWTEHEQKKQWAQTQKKIQEENQRRKNPKKKQKIEQQKITPDFLFQQEVFLKIYRNSNNRLATKKRHGQKQHHQQHQQYQQHQQQQQPKQRDRRIVEERSIFWIEAKMFYGASSIPQNTSNAVGTIMQKAKKYVEHFGPGAILFMYGCGDRLAYELSQVGVTALDCFGATVSLKDVEKHQRNWCANEHGVILP